MTIYVDDEEEVWKCPKHPSRRRRTGICHVCLKERLSSLCPECANVRPCTCYYAAATSSSGSSSSSSFSQLSAAAAEGVGTVARVSNLIESEPAFRRSRSLAVPFLRSKPTAAEDRDYSPRMNGAKTSSFWSLLKGSSNSKSKRVEGELNGVVVRKEGEDAGKKYEEEEMRRMMMRKSRSVVVTSESSNGDVRSTKGKRWHFPSPIKVFRQSISRGLLHERSPLYRG